MRRREQARPLQEPAGVRIERADGTTVSCAVFRDEDHDQDGNTAWAVVPEDGYAFKPGDTLRVDVLPPKTSVYFAIEPA